MVMMATVYALVGCQQNHSPATNQRNAMQATVTSTNAKYDEWKSVVESYGAYDDSVITDTDWNAQFSRSGTMRSTAFEQKQEGDDSFYRVTLSCLRFARMCFPIATKGSWVSLNTIAFSQNMFHIVYILPFCFFMKQD